MSEPLPLSAQEAVDAVHWLSLSRACVVNGDDLVQDAQLLREHGRASRALSLAVLALEEYGKAMQALLVVGSGGSATEKQAYQQLQNAHRPKLEAIVAWLGILNPAEQLDESFVERAEAEVQVMATAKMAGFYVDRTDTGVVAPSQTSADQARQYLELAKVAGAHLRHPLAVIIGEQELHAWWRHGPRMSEAVAAAIDRDGGSSVVNELRAVLPKFGLPLAASTRARDRMHFLGVDLAWADGRVSANETGLVLLDPDGRVLAAGWTRGVAQTLDWIDAHVEMDNVLAFVDAPLVVTNLTGQRVCERQVGQCYGRWKVSANSTNTFSRNAAGTALRARLEALGWAYDAGMAGPPTTGRHVSECYPYTTLVGAAELGYASERPTYKRKPRGVPTAQWRSLRAAVCDDLVTRLGALAGVEPALDLSTHPVTAALLADPSPLVEVAYKHREDLIDAALCAWTASLWSRYGFARCQVLGESDSGDPATAATIIAPARWEQRAPAATEPGPASRTVLAGSACRRAGADV